MFDDLALLRVVYLELEYFDTIELFKMVHFDNYSFLFLNDFVHPLN